MKNVVEDIKSADCFLPQVDVSLDECTVDNKFLTARFLGQDKPITTLYIAESYSETHDAEGLLDAVVLTLKQLSLEEISKQKLTGLTTDGESANNGRKSGRVQILKLCLPQMFWACGVLHIALI